MIKSILVELVGTFWLALATFTLSAYAGTPGFVALYVPLGVAATYGLLVAIFAPLGGGHFNPAVTLGWILRRRIFPVKAGLYIIAQLLGAGIAALLFRFFSGNTAIVMHGADMRAILAEGIGALLLVWVVVSADVASIWTGMLAGVGLFVALSITQAYSGGILNPAIALASGSFGLAYLLAPLIGGGIGALVASYFTPVKISQ